MISDLLNWWFLAQAVLGIAVGLAILVLDQRWFSRWYQIYLTAKSADQSREGTGDQGGDLTVNQPENLTSDGVGDQKKVITRSSLFLLCYWPLALYVTSSSSSLFGQGVVIGLGSLLGWEVWRLRAWPARFKQHFQLPVTSKLTTEEVKAIAYGWLMGLVVLGLITVF